MGKWAGKRVPCTRCGSCCATSPCRTAIVNMIGNQGHVQPGPCPYLLFDAAGVAACGLLEQLRQEGRRVSVMAMETDLLIGRGCTNQRPGGRLFAVLSGQGG